MEPDDLLWRLQKGTSQRKSFYFSSSFDITHPDLPARVRLETEVNIETTGLEIWRKKSVFVLPLFPTKHLIYSSLINTLYLISFFIRVFGHDVVARKPTRRFPWNHQRSWVYYYSIRIEHAYMRVTSPLTLLCNGLHDTHRTEQMQSECVVGMRGNI